MFTVSIGNTLRLFYLQTREVPKRQRSQVTHFQSPDPEMLQMMKSLKKKDEETKTEKPQETNPVVFFKYDPKSYSWKNRVDFT